MDILDCTLRDGGYINNWRFSDKFNKNFCDVLEKNNISYVEIGFINKTNKYKNKIVGDYRILTKEKINSFSKYNFKTVVMADYTDINLDILKQKINIDLVRIAFHKKDCKNALEICNIVKNMGYKVSVNAMGVTNYSENELEYLFNYINKTNLDILYIADSYGSLHQEDIEKYLIFLDSKLNKNCKIGFHLHNNMNNAYGNYEFLKNISKKFKRKIIVDTTMFGMGRGAGNLQTELVIMNKNKNIKFKNILDILIFIQDYIKPIYRISENYWSYDIDYLLSGYLKMHPNYIVKMRDLKISMKNRFFLIEKMIEKKIKYNYFDIDVIFDLIKEYKNLLL